MADEHKSRLYKLKPLTDRLPAVKRPDGHVHFRTKILWVILMLVFYFVMTNVFIYGLDKSRTIDIFASYRAILAGAQGSLMHLGIGPIVTASIIMQLLPVLSPAMKKIQEEGEVGRQKMNQWTRYLTVVLCSVQTFFVATWLHRNGQNNPKPSFNGYWSWFFSPARPCPFQRQPGSRRRLACS